MAMRAWRPNCRWNVAPPFAGAGELAAQLRTSGLVVQALHNRGIDGLDACQAFLNPRMSQLHDPLLLGGVEAAAQRIARAVRDREKIVIYGDYDVDGITAVAILHACLRLVGGEAEFYVPHRVEEGYGVNSDAVRKMIAKKVGLMITVDCGISAAGPLAEAARAGLDVIVTDHHALPQTLPPAVAIVHPGLPGANYPNRELSGAGVAFKLAWQVARAICGNTRVDPAMKEFLLDSMCLAALGTIADVVPLTDENRVLATFGLRGLTASRNPGLAALLESADLKKKPDAYDVGFLLAPRLNAAGRMGHANEAIELLTTASPERCAEITRTLVQQNTERQQVERAITEQAAEMVVTRGLDAPDRKAIVLAGEGWHGGVIGIVASRLVDRFHRPVVMLAINGDGSAQGSGRSVPGFNLVEALAACESHLQSFGGHAMAGGVRLSAKAIDDFAAALLDYAAQHLPEKAMEPTLEIDAETTLAALNVTAAQHFARLAPFGQGNPPPAVLVRSCRLAAPPRRMGRTGNVLNLVLTHNGASLRAVGFGMGELADRLAGVGTVDVVGEPILNKFNGNETAELKLLDVIWT